MVDPVSMCREELDRTSTIVDTVDFTSDSACWTSGLWNRVGGGSSSSIRWASRAMPDPERRRRDGDAEVVSRDLGASGMGESSRGSTRRDTRSATRESLLVVLFVAGSDAEIRIEGVGVLCCVGVLDVVVESSRRS